jgi:hypothetical protein
MSRFAHFDPSAVAPAPVIGWYDTNSLAYPNLPAESGLVAVTDAQWALHFSNPSGWFVKDGKLIDLE